MSSSGAFCVTAFALCEAVNVVAQVDDDLIDAENERSIVAEVVDDLVDGGHGVSPCRGLGIDSRSCLSYVIIHYITILVKYPKKAQK